MIRDLERGSGIEAARGDRVTVHIQAETTDGREIADTVKRGLGFTFVIGRGDEMPFLSPGVAGMAVGGVRRIDVPAALAAGQRGNVPVIPPDTALIVTVRLVKVVQP